MPFNILLALFFLIPFILHCSSQPNRHPPAHCPADLIWRRMSFLDNALSISIEVCCNISKVTVVEVGQNWVLKRPIADQAPIETVTVPGFEMQLSVCSDGTVAPGQVLKEDCRSEIGRVLQFGYDHLHEFDQWYITCFHMDSLQKSCKNKFCYLERFCTNCIKCDRVWVTREIVNTTKTNMTILIKVGNILDGTDLTVEVDEMTPGTIPKPRPVQFEHSKEDLDGNFYRTTATAPNGKTLIYQVTNLNPNKYYVVRTCGKMRVPKSFYKYYPQYINVIPKEIVHCLDDAVYNPSRYWFTNSSSGKWIYANLMWIICAMITVFSM